MPRKDRINQKNRIRENVRSDRKSNLESRELVKSRIKRNKKRKRRKLISKLIFVAIIAGLIYIAYIYKEKTSNQDLENEFISDYYTDDYDRDFKLYSGDIYYQKHIKDEETGIYKKLDAKDYVKNSKTKRNIEYYLFEKVNEVLEEYDISQEYFNLSIKTDDYILGINEKKVMDGISLSNLSTLNALAKGLNENALSLNSTISITRDDIEKGSNIYGESSIGTEYTIESILETATNRNDSASYNMLNRYLSNNGYSVSAYKSNLLGRETTDLSVMDALKIFEDYRFNRNEINRYYNNILQEDDTLFQDSIYSNLPNKNIIINEDNLKFDLSYIDGDYPYYYSIYSDKLTEEQIRYIGDVVNRTISEINLVKTIQR